MTNQEFCYWLQGYFEISKTPAFARDKIIVIKETLQYINQPLGEFTQWLFEVVSFFEEQQYRQELLDYFLPIVTQKLYMVFHHVIDNSYDTPLSALETQNIHDGRVS